MRLFVEREIFDFISTLLEKSGLDANIKRDILGACISHYILSNWSDPVDRDKILEDFCKKLKEVIKGIENELG